MNDMNENPVSVEEFEAMNPELVGAMRNAVRRELELSRADGEKSQAHGLHNPLLVVPDVPLVFGDALDGVGQRGDRLVGLAQRRPIPGVLGGLDRILLHVLTSFLLAGGLIIASKALVSKEGGAK